MSEHVFSSFLPLPSPRSRSSCWHLTGTPVSAVSYVFLPLSQWHLIPRASFDLCRWLWRFCRIGWQMLEFWLRDYETWCAHDTVLIDFPRKEKKNWDKKGKAWLLMRWDTTCLPIFSKTRPERLRAAQETMSLCFIAYCTVCSRLTLSGF